MPIYIVRWPQLCASLIKAKNEEDLIDKLDEVGDPGGCTWSEYQGPIWIDFDIPVKFVPLLREKKRPMSMDEIDIEGVEELADSGIELSLSQPEGDTGNDMKHEIIKQAFPAVASFLESEKGAEIDATGLKAALREDLRKLVEYDWRLAKLDKRTDPEAELFKQLGISTRVPALGFDSADEDDSD